MPLPPLKAAFAKQMENFTKVVIADFAAKQMEILGKLLIWDFFFPPESDANPEGLVAEIPKFKRRDSSKLKTNTFVKTSLCV